MQSPVRLFSIIAATLGASGVVLGAFGAHALKGFLTESALETFDTGVRYHLIHAVALLIIAQISRTTASPWITRSLSLIAVGTLLFSGSLYGLVLTGSALFGPITPIGGACLIGGWLCLLAATLLEKSDESDAEND
jgi:uncharacterized membrane protein YgdD (TMEM256/DUF423 family)